jgi:hypothetical protein
LAISRGAKKPLWALIVFEMPEYVNNMLSVGSFPLSRIRFIDFFNQVLIIIEKKISPFPRLYLISKSGVISILEWVNNNWKKQYR